MSEGEGRTPKGLVHRRALKQAIAETTHMEHEREHLFDELEAQGLNLQGVVEMRNRVPELCQKLGCSVEMGEKLHHYCCQEYSRVLKVEGDERACVAPTISYIKWSNSSSVKQQQQDNGKTSKLSGIPKMQSLGNTPVVVSRPEREGEGGKEEESEPTTASSVKAKFEVTDETVSVELNPGQPLVPSPEWRAGGAPCLNTTANFNKREEKRREQLELELSEASKRAEEEKQRKERLFKLALRGPKAKRPASASPKFSVGPHKLQIDVAMEARAERKTELMVQEEMEAKRRQKEERQRKAKLKQMALKGPAVPPRPQRPKSATSPPNPTAYADCPSPNRYVPSTSSFKPFLCNSSERAKQRAKFEEYLKEKESIEAAREREMRVLEEKEAERKVKELRKSMEFKANRKPDFEKVKFSPKNLHYNEPKEPGQVSLREHVREREAAKVAKKEEERILEEERAAQEYKDLRKSMSSFKARKMPNFGKKPFSPVLNRGKKGSP